MDTAQLIQHLSLPAAYPHPVDAVELHQTHISAVFLAGPYAYKVKKPLDLGFLDFTQLDRRRHFCEEEVRLNRRLAPDVYVLQKFGIITSREEFIAALRRRDIDWNDYLVMQRNLRLADEIGAQVVGQSAVKRRDRRVPDLQWTRYQADRESRAHPGRPGHLHSGRGDPAVG